MRQRKKAGAAPVAAGLSLLAVLIAVAGCSSSQSSDSGSAAPSSGGAMAPGGQPGQRSASTAPAGGNGGDGASIFQQNCGRCHKAGSAGSGRNDLSHVGAEKNQQWIEVQIRDPQQHHSRMPSFPPDRLPDAQLHILSAYLAAMK